MCFTAKLILVIFLVFFTFCPVAAADGLRVAVIEFDPIGDLQIKDAGKIVAELMLTSLSKEGHFEVKARDILLKKVLQEQALSASGIIDTKTALRIGEIYGVQAIVTGSISKFGNTFNVNARVIDTQTGSVLKAESIQVYTVDEIPEKVAKLAGLLSLRTEPGQKKYELLHLGFYNSGIDNNIPNMEEQLNSSFSRKQARFINARAKYKNPFYGIKDSYFEVMFEFIKPDGSLFGRVRGYARPKKEWSIANYFQGWGWDQPGNWPIGEYTVKAYFEGQYVGQAQFLINN